MFFLGSSNMPKNTDGELRPKRRYSGPPKGSEEAKERMAKVRAAQWAKNGLVYGPGEQSATPATQPSNGISYNYNGHSAASFGAQSYPQ